MKVDLRLAPETAVIIAATLEAVYNTKAFTRRNKAVLSIALDVAAKLDGKAVLAKGKRNQFDAKKKMRVSLKFHEADMLELLLIQQVKDVQEPYIKQQIQKTINDLNQKLV